MSRVQNDPPVINEPPIQELTVDTNKLEKADEALENI